MLMVSISTAYCKEQDTFSRIFLSWTFLSKRSSNLRLFLLQFLIFHRPNTATNEVEEDSLDESKIDEFLREIFSDLSVDREESNDFVNLLKGESTAPPKSKLVWIRAAAFRIGSEYVSEDRDTNVKLLRSINAVVHCIERTCLR